MILLTELARVLRLADPMPPRVIEDALAAGTVLRKPHTDARRQAAAPARPASDPAATVAGSVAGAADSRNAGSAAAGARAAGSPPVDLPAAGTADLSAGAATVGGSVAEGVAAADSAGSGSAAEGVAAMDLADCESAGAGAVVAGSSAGAVTVAGSAGGCSSAPGSPVAGSRAAGPPSADSLAGAAAVAGPASVAESWAATPAAAGGASGWLSVPAALPRPRAAVELIVLTESVPAVRSAGRRLSIGHPDGEPVIQLEIRHLGDTQRLAGLAAAPMTIRHEQGDREIDGYFNVELPAGPIKIVLGGAETEWL